MVDDNELGLPWRGLRRYVAMVADAIGAEPGAWCCDRVVPVGAYIALEQQVPRYPGRDIAVVWDEENGWAAAIETGCGEDVIVLGYLGGDLVPPPGVVAEFVSELLADGYPGQPDPPAVRTADDPDALDELLAEYALAAGDFLPAPAERQPRSTAM